MKIPFDSEICDKTKGSSASAVHADMIAERTMEVASLFQLFTPLERCMSSVGDSKGIPNGGKARLACRARLQGSPAVRGDFDRSIRDEKNQGLEMALVHRVFGKYRNLLESIQGYIPGRWGSMLRLARARCAGSRKGRGPRCDRAEFRWARNAPRGLHDGPTRAPPGLEGCECPAWWARPARFTPESPLWMHAGVCRRADWSTDALRRRFGAEWFHVGSGEEDGEPRFLRLRHFLRLAARRSIVGESAAAHEDEPPYLFDATFHTACPELGAMYSAPRLFAPGVDVLFEQLPPAERPDYRWLLIGAAGTPRAREHATQATSLPSFSAQTTHAAGARALRALLQDASRRRAQRRRRRGSRARGPRGQCGWSARGRWTMLRPCLSVFSDSICLQRRI